MTPRYVLMLLGELPETSAFAASARGGAHMRPWTTQAYLAAATVNVLAAANHQRAGRKGRFKPLVSPPKPERRRRARTVTVAQILARRGGRPPS